MHRPWASPQTPGSEQGDTPFPLLLLELPGRGGGWEILRCVINSVAFPFITEFMRVSFRSLRKYRSAKGRRSSSLVFQPLR